MDIVDIELEDVSLGWRDRIALRAVSGKFAQGSLTAVVGPNGGGKTTLLKAIQGGLRPLRGRIALSEAARTQMVGLPQQSELDRSYPITVYDLVGLGAWRRCGIWRGLDETGHARVQSALEAVGLQGQGGRLIGTLSGGQLQRALFARLMMSDAKVLLLDEPFSAVDQETLRELLALLVQWHEQGRTVVVVLHDLELVRTHFPQTLLLAGQAVAWGDTDSVLTPEHLHLARHLSGGYTS